MYVEIEQSGSRPACIGCGLLPAVKDREVVELVDLPYAGTPSRLCWRKVRFVCRNDACEVISCPETRFRAA